MKKHIINLAKKPFVPESWILESHIKGDKAWEFDASKIELWLSKKQKTSYQVGAELQKEVPNPFNANLLDYLLEHKELIPEDWKGKWVFFHGTVYRGSGGGLCVRCLVWNGDGWNWNFYWLVNGFLSGSPAAVMIESNPKTLSASPSLDFSPSEILKLKKFAESLK